MEKNPDLEKIEVVELKPVEIVAIQSPVQVYSETYDGDVTLGHIGMFDLEDVELEAVKRVVKEKLGFGFILNSHGDNYHIWKPKVESLQSIRELKESISLDDDSHNIIGVEKNCYALRVTEKGDKPVPQPVEFVKADDVNLKDYTFSKPHLDILCQKFGFDMAFNIRSECKTVGKHTQAVLYETYENNHDADDLADAEEVVKNRRGIYNG